VSASAASAPATVELRAPQEQTEGTRSQVLRWLKTLGAQVAREEPLVELETDKVTVEVVSPADGVLAQILKGESDEVAPGELLGLVAIEDTPAHGAAAPVPRVAITPERAPSGTPRRAREGAAPAPSPAVARLLREHQLTASAIAGTGPRGRIKVDDVLAAAARVAEAAPAAADAAAGDAAAGDATVGDAAADADSMRRARRVPHSALRRRTAQRMVQSLLLSAPHVTTVFEADFGAVLAHRARHAERYAQSGARLTLSAYLLAACVPALRAVPEVNAHWSEDALEIFEDIDIGVATAIEGGLLVPIVRDVGHRSLLELARELDDRVTRAREGRLSPADVRGGTFSVSNHGVSGDLLAAPIVIVPPQVAILGMGKLESRAVVVGSGDDERIVARPRAYLTLTIDHRALDGAQANRFMQVLVERIASWPLAD
jgi:2-oxoglutarate dehydrogenase E2 component (dihydrolipoamide succinyltransferase)